MAFKTAYFSTAIGGASEMANPPNATARASTSGRRALLRVLLVVVVVPAILQYGGVHGLDPSCRPRSVNVPGCWC